MCAYVGAIVGNTSSCSFVNGFGFPDGCRCRERCSVAATADSRQDTYTYLGTITLEMDRYTLPRAFVTEKMKRVSFRTTNSSNSRCSTAQTPCT
jgi:hypothetical protein